MDAACLKHICAPETGEVKIFCILIKFTLTFLMSFNALLQAKGHTYLITTVVHWAIVWVDECGLENINGGNIAFT